MNYLSVVYSFLILFSILNYLALNSKKTAIQLVNQMGIGYNLGQTFQCCNNSQLEQINDNQIKLYGTILPNKKTINKIKKYGFNTIRFQVTYSNFSLENETINYEWISGIKKVISWITNLELYCIFCIKQDSEFWEIEEVNVKNKYSNFWKQIANEFKHFDEHLIFEIINEKFQFYTDLLNFTQIFIDVIRNSGGFNEDRLLIIPEMFTELEIESYYDILIPIDPANKTAISINYFYPSGITYYENDSFEWYHKYYNISYRIRPITDWGSDDEYNGINEFFILLKKTFIDKGIPVIIDEAAILNKYNNDISSFREFIYVFFSFSKEYEGILSCLWDNPIDSEENLHYYNKKLDKWNDEIIKESIYKISKGNSVKSSEFYKLDNHQTFYPNYNGHFGHFYIIFNQKKIQKIFFNAKLFGIFDEDFELIIYSINNNGNYYYKYITKKNSKKQYDGTTNFEIDTTKEDISSYVIITPLWGDENIIFNNATFEFKDLYSYFDFIAYKDYIKSVIS